MTTPNPPEEPTPPAPHGLASPARPPAPARRLPPWAIALGRWLLAAAWLGPAWVASLHFEPAPLAPESEPSWVAVMTQAIIERWQFGPDIIYTYGPFASLFTSTFSGKIYAGVFVTQLIFNAILIGLVFWLGRRLPPAQRLVFLLTTAFVATLGWYLLCLFAVAGAGLALCGKTRAARWLSAPALALLAALALAKGTFVFYALVALGCVVGHFLLQRRWGRALLPAAGFVLFFCAGWVLLGQNLSNVPSFLRGSREVTDGFTQAMSLPPRPGVLPLGLLMAGVLLGQHLFLLAWSRPSGGRANWPMFLTLCVGLLLAWKIGFARADGAHVGQWIFYALLSVTAAPLFFDSGLARRGEAGRRVGAAVHWASVLAVFALAAAAIEQGRIDTRGEQLAALWARSFHTLFHPRAAAEEARAQVLDSRRRHALPRTRAIVGRQSVDVFGQEQAIAQINALPYRPRPSFEGYCTYTPYLMGLNVDFYRSARSPAYALFKMQSIDRRLPALDDGPLLVMLAHGYDPVQAERGYLLLKRRGAPADLPAPARFPTAVAGEIAPDQTLPLPGDGGPLWCELDIRETLLGKLLRFLYQEPPVFLELADAQGAFVRYRIVPAMARSGFLVSPLLKNERDFLLFAADEPQPPVQAIRVTGIGGWSRCFQPRIAYRLARVPPAAPGGEAADAEVRLPEQAAVPGRTAGETGRAR